MVNDEDNCNTELSDDEVEKKLDFIWENWASRRACEQKHTPTFIKKGKPS
ncbi:MAG: hypothetical protein ACTSR8_09705 [Promethearchaeota archaeon]